MRDFLLNIILPLATFVIGYLSGIYFPHKFRRDDRLPKISIGPLQERANYFDVTNHGGDLLEIAINLIWLQDGKEQVRMIEQYFLLTEDPLIAAPHKSNTIKRNETKKATTCPLYSDNGRVQVVVEGKGLDGKDYHQQFILKNLVK